LFIECYVERKKAVADGQEERVKTERSHDVEPILGFHGTPTANVCRGKSL
jgi:hypothetical protein